MAKADVEAAEARLEEAEAILDKYEAEVDRWDTEVKRLERQVARVVINPLVLFESTNQLKSSIAALDKAKATIKRAKAELLAARARLEKAQVDVRVAEATLKVAESEERYAQAWVDYLTLTAPFPGVISARNANTFDFVQPTTGDPTAYYLSPDISPSGTAAPIYVVDRLDIVRIFLDIPERDANFVNIGTKASVLARAFRDTELPATVTRISWALNMKSRTLRAEVDLAQPRQPALARDVRLRQGDHRASGRPGAAARRHSSIAATRPSAGSTRAARQCGPKSRRASATTSGSRSPIAGPRSHRRRPATRYPGRRSTARNR